MVELVGRGAVLLVAAAFLAAVGACAGPDGSPSPPSSTAPSVPAGPGPSTMDCGDSALLQAPAEALSVFPDSPDVAWTARPSDELLADLILVSMTPEPASAGHPEFRFVYRCDAAGPSYVAAYGLEGEEFVLLTTAPALAETELPDALP